MDAGRCKKMIVSRVVISPLAAAVAATVAAVITGGAADDVDQFLDN